MTVNTSITLNVEQLGFAYSEQPVLHDVNVNLQGGEMVGVIGPNGAGKSTFLRLLLGLLKPAQGCVSLNSKTLERMSRREISQHLTLVPQDVHMNYAFTVEELVMMGRHPWLKRFQAPGPQDQTAVEHAMAQTQVENFAQRPINQLSGGERQRVLIARAIAQQTPIILLDEATANLDICHQLEIMSLAKSLAAQGHLVIAAIHDLSMASRFCDRLLLFANHGLQANAKPEQVVTTANLKQFFHLDADVHPLLGADGSHHGLLIAALGSTKGVYEQADKLEQIA